MAGATVLMMETTSYPVMVIARVLQGFSGTGIFTLGLSLIADSVPEERLGVIAGTCLSGYSLGQVSVGDVLCCNCAGACGIESGTRNLSFPAC